MSEIYEQNSKDSMLDNIEKELKLAINTITSIQKNCAEIKRLFNEESSKMQNPNGGEYAK